MYRLSVFCLFIVLITSNAFAQKIDVGIEFGFNMRHDIGKNVIADSLIVMADGYTGGMQNVYGVYGDIELSEKMKIHSVLGYTNQLSGYLLYNKEDDSIFGPVVKGSVTSAHNVNLLFTMQYDLIGYKGFRVHLLAGFRSNFLINENNDPIQFREGTRHQGIAEVINNMDQANRRLYMNYSLGIQLSYWRLKLNALYDANFANSSYTKSIKFFEESYRFHNQTEAISLTLGFKLF